MYHKPDYQTPLLLESCLAIVEFAQKILIISQYVWYFCGL